MVAARVATCGKPLRLVSDMTDQDNCFFRCVKGMFFPENKNHIGHREVIGWCVRGWNHVSFGVSSCRTRARDSMGVKDNCLSKPVPDCVAKTWCSANKPMHLAPLDENASSGEQKDGAMAARQQSRTQQTRG